MKVASDPVSFPEIVDQDQVMCGVSDLSEKRRTVVTHPGEEFLPRVRLDVGLLQANQSQSEPVDQEQMSKLVGDGFDSLFPSAGYPENRMMGCGSADSRKDCHGFLYTMG